MILRRTCPPLLEAPFEAFDKGAAEVNKMINAYKAPVTPKDAGAIVEYLTWIKGAKK
jgi:hypothetical protein